MSDLIQLTKDGDIAVITINNPPVNALSPGVPEGISEAIDQINEDRTVNAAVLIGGGRTFIAGADIKEFGKITSGKAKTGAGLLPLLLKIEDCSKPVVMAIHGTAFGGGLEVAMAGHYRVAAPGAQVGQPEVKLGIIPGAAGTQRLPRLAGVAKAVEMCADGNPVKAADALKAGIVDQLIEGDLLAGAVAFAREIAGKPAPKTRERNQKLGTPEQNAAIFAAARDTARKKQRNLIAPLAAIDAVEAATKLPFEEGCEVEAQAVHRVPVLRPVEGADSRLLRRARSGQDPGHPERNADHPGEFRRGRRRRHHGRRHRDGLCQRRHSGAAQGNRPGGARPRPGDHSQELRRRR